MHYCSSFHCWSLKGMLFSSSQQRDVPEPASSQTSGLQLFLFSCSSCFYVFQLFEEFEQLWKIRCPCCLHGPTTAPKSAAMRRQGIAFSMLWLENFGKQLLFSPFSVIHSLVNSRISHHKTLEMIDICFQSISLHPKVLLSPCLWEPDNGMLSPHQGKSMLFPRMTTSIWNPHKDV